MQNEKLRKMSWEVLVVFSVFSFIFLLTFRLALAVEPQRGYTDIDVEYEYQCRGTSGSANDCDGDGLAEGCDLNDQNPSIVMPDDGTDGKGCDVETDPEGLEGAGDGFVDTACLLKYLRNEDGSLDLRSTTEVEYYSRHACDNCPNAWNPDQIDFDRDGLGDICDPDPEVPNPIGEHKQQKYQE